MDAANVDLKGFTEEFYRTYCGGRLQPVLDTLRWLARESQTWLEITNLVIPGANDSPDDIGGMCQWIATELGPDVPLHFSAFHPDFKLTDRRATPPATLQAAHDIARDAGLRYVYTGNVFDPEHQHTYCPGCGRAVIRRDGYAVGRIRVAGRPLRQLPDANRRPVRRDSRHVGRKAGSSENRRLRIDFNLQFADGRTLWTALRLNRPNPFGHAPRPAFSKEQEATIFRAAGRRVTAAVRREPSRIDPQPAGRRGRHAGLRRVRHLEARRETPLVLRAYRIVDAALQGVGPRRRPSGDRRSSLPAHLGRPNSANSIWTCGSCGDRSR